jgi:hypothetical protein
MKMLTLADFLVVIDRNIGRRPLLVRLASGLHAPVTHIEIPMGTDPAGSPVIMHLETDIREGRRLISNLLKEIRSRAT